MFQRLVVREHACNLLHEHSRYLVCHLGGSKLHDTSSLQDLEAHRRGEKRICKP